MNPSTGFSGRQGLDQSDLTKYRSYVPGVDDVIWQPFYDYLLYPTAGALQFNFFTNQKGQGATSAFGAAAGAKTIFDTNMTLSGQLGAGNQFLLLGIEVELWPTNLPSLEVAAALPSAAQMGRNWDDVYSILRNGQLVLTIQNREYANDTPLMKFPPQTGLQGVAALNSTTNAAASYQQIEYASGAGLAYNIVPVLIMQNQAFSVQVNFPAAIASPSGVDLRIGVRLNGKLVRNAQ